MTWRQKGKKREKK